MTHELFSIKGSLAGSTAPVSICKLSVAGTTYTETVVATSAYGSSPLDFLNGTIDDNTGDIYFLADDRHVEHYSAVAGTIVPHTAVLPAMVAGMRYNPADNKLYALQPYGAQTVFVKIDPSGITSLDSLDLLTEVKRFGACIDPCSNRYLFSSALVANPDIHVLYRLNTSGSLVQQDTVAGLLTGMDIDY